MYLRSFGRQYNPFLNRISTVQKISLLLNLSEMRHENAASYRTCGRRIPHLFGEMAEEVLQRLPRGEGCRPEPQEDHQVFEGLCPFPESGGFFEPGKAQGGVISLETGFPMKITLEDRRWGLMPPYPF